LKILTKIAFLSGYFNPLKMPGRKIANRKQST